MEFSTEERAIANNHDKEWRYGLRQFREQLKISQGEFAKLVGLTNSTLSRLEHGNLNLSPKMIKRLQDGIAQAMVERQRSINSTIPLALALCGDSQQVHFASLIRRKFELDGEYGETSRCIP